MPRSTRTITSSVCRPCTRCRPACALPARKWRSGWTASWCASTTLRQAQGGRLIKTHVRQPKGGRATDPEDYPAELSAYTTKAPDCIKHSAAKLGPAVAEFADRLFDGPLPWARIRQGHKLLRLGERYAAKRLDAACLRALDVDLIDVRRVERILVQALEQDAIPPNCRHPSQPVVSPGPAPSSPMLMPKEVSHDPRH